jgi:hypothetical protein
MAAAAPAAVVKAATAAVSVIGPLLVLNATSR